MPQKVVYIGRPLVGEKAQTIRITTMSNFDKALDLFSKKIPTQTEFTELWRSDFQKFSNDERKKYSFMCKFAKVHHSTEAMISNNQYDSKKADYNYQEIFNTNGSLKGWLPESVDSDALKNNLLTAKSAHEAGRQQLIKDRSAMVNAEIEHLKSSLKAINDRLSALSLSYSPDDTSMFPNHGDMLLTDLETEKKYHFNFTE